MTKEQKEALTQAINVLEDMMIGKSGMARSQLIVLSEGLSEVLGLADDSSTVDYKRPAEPQSEPSRINWG